MPLLDLPLLRRSAFEHACDNPAAGYWISGFLILVGLLYGISVAVFQRAAGLPLYGIPLEQFSDPILFGGNMLAGTMIVVAAHIGVVLIAWLMVRGVKGGGHLLMLYRASAYGLPLTIPALPLIAWLSLEEPVRAAAAAPEGLLIALGAAGGLLSLMGLLQALIVSQAMPWSRAAAAAILTFGFGGSVLMII